MTWNFDYDRTIYQQIMDKVIERIVSGTYKPGEKLPAVRELALEAGVNPNTIQKAYAEIERRGIIIKKRGDGSYITENKEVLKLLSEECLETAVEEFLKKVKPMGMTKEEVLKAVELSLEGGKE